MFALGCIQALRCHQNTCPAGVTTHNKRFAARLVVQEKSERVANYAFGMNKEIDMIAHACGCRHARDSVASTFASCSPRARAWP